jgi:hypothetical protein
VGHEALADKTECEQRRSMFLVYYRGGNSLTPTPGDVRIDPTTGLLRTTHGVSVYDRPDNLDRFGGAFRVSGVPDRLMIVQRGRDPHHFEIVPAHAMTFAEYEDALKQIVLTRV